jgi:hypothetical protein
MYEDLKKLLEYLIEEELEEQNALGGGGVGATSSGLALDATKFRPPPKKKLEEVNTVFGSYDLFSAMEDNNSGFDSIDENENNFGEDKGDDSETPDSKSKKNKSQHHIKKNHKNNKKKNIYTDIMWKYADLPTGQLPQLKYTALEEQAVPKKKADRVRIFQDKGHPMKQQSLEVLIDFIKFCNSILKLEDMPDIYLHTVKKKDMTTGMYNRGEHMIHVLVGKRLLVDVLRTIAHELTHARQEEAGLLDKHLANVDPMDEMGDIDTIYENEAYTLAGNIVKIFCRKYPKISKDELYQLNEARKKL